MTRANIPVKCTRCRHCCMESEWLYVRTKRYGGCREKTCPRCGCRSYYDCTPQVAWCWPSGLIEIGDAMPADNADGSGAIEVARGPKYALKGQLSAVARHAYSLGQLLVPGVPEAETQEAKADALGAWLDWCGKPKSRDGVTFSRAAS